MRASGVFCAFVNCLWDTGNKLKNCIFFCKFRILPYICNPVRGNSSVGRARPCQGRGREFESRFPLKNTHICLIINALCAMYNTFNISFYCRKSKENAKGLAPIEVRVCYNGSNFMTSLPRKANPQDFKMQMASRKQTSLKTYTSAIASKIEDLQIKLLLEGKPFTKEALQTYIYYGFTEQHYTVGAMMQRLFSKSK